MDERERVQYEDAAWLAYKTARGQLRKATCPLQRIALEARLVVHLAGMG